MHDPLGRMLALKSLVRGVILQAIEPARNAPLIRFSADPVRGASKRNCYFEALQSGVRTCGSQPAIRHLVVQSETNVARPHLEKFQVVAYRHDFVPKLFQPPALLY